MAESGAPYQRWGVVNVLMRLKNKIRERFFCDRFLTDLDLPPENEDFAPTHPQYYNAMDGSEPQTDDSPQFQTFTAMLEGNEQDGFLTLADFDMDDQTGLPTDPVYAEYGCAESEYYVDARMELPESNYSAAAAAATTTTTTLSRVETTEMMDTGDSSAMLQPAEWQQIMFLRQFLEIDDGVVPAGAGWRVVLSIVSAFRRISGLIRNRRLQRTASGQTIVNTTRRIGPGTRYKGIRPRHGKWVSEIRIGGTAEKVWLGSYHTEKEAALAFDAGKHHCSSRRSRFNFADSPRLLGAPENLLHLSSVDRRERIQRLVEDYVRAYGNADIR